MNPLIADAQHFPVDGHFSAQAAVDRIVLQQMRHGFNLAVVVDGHNLDLRIFPRNPIDQTTDPAETIDADFSSHGNLPFRY